MTPAVSPLLRGQRLATARTGKRTPLPYGTRSLGYPGPETRGSTQAEG